MPNMPRAGRWPSPATELCAGKSTTHAFLQSRLRTFKRRPTSTKLSRRRRFPVDPVAQRTGLRCLLQLDDRSVNLANCIGDAGGADRRDPQVSRRATTPNTWLMNEPSRRSGRLESRRDRRCPNGLPGRWLAPCVPCRRQSPGAPTAMEIAKAQVGAGASIGCQS